VAGIEAVLETVLVLTGSKSLGEAEKYPFRSSRILQSIADAIELV
jgi:NagD protein